MSSSMLKQRFELVQTDTLNPYPNNPRNGDIEGIVESIRANGFWGVLIVQEDTRTILAGNHRWMGAMELEMPEVWVSWVNVDEATQIKINLADNRLAEKGGYDKGLQLAQLDRLDDLIGTGYDHDYHDWLKGIIERDEATNINFSDNGVVPGVELPHSGATYPEQQQYQNNEVSNEDDASKVLPEIQMPDPEDLEGLREVAPDLAEKVSAGDMTLANAKKNVRDRNRQTRREEEAARVESLPVQDLKIVHGDFRNVELEEGSVDAIITDPPYPREFVGLYSDLSEWAAHVLKPGGIVAAVSGHVYLPDISGRLAENLDYLWCLSLYQPGQKNQVFQRRALVGWKPILVYSNGPYDGPWYYDVLQSDVRDKDFHEWGQSESCFAGMMELFSRGGDLVVDPFLGGGTAGVVAKSLKRRFVGIELDNKNFEVCQKRINPSEAQ